MRDETGELKALLYELRGDTSHEEVRGAAARVGAAMHEHMTRLGVWETAGPADRAAVLSAMVSGSDLATQSDAARAEETARHLVELVQHVIGLCDGVPYPSQRQLQIRDSGEIYRRLLVLPEGWRQEVVRRVHAGEYMTSAVHQARMAINRLRSRGIEPTRAVSEPTEPGRAHR
ncbi:hypothetical protein [Streptomyces sp. NPDC048845]|uniref:hypothetical protein n=1 Tax=Streptomyces sp. NPDC048845 TaxID=3155390 RepID=UPI0034343968